MLPLWVHTTRLVTPEMHSRDAVSNPTSNIYGMAHPFFTPPTRLTTFYLMPPKVMAVACLR